MYTNLMLLEAQVGQYQHERRQAADHERAARALQATRRTAQWREVEHPREQARLRFHFLGAH